jgi:hypothetical protein
VSSENTLPKKRKFTSAGAFTHALIAGLIRE